MTDSFNNHLDPDDAESYSLGRLPQPEVERLEEHLLVCEPCRGLVAEADDYVSAIRSAAEELGDRKSKSHSQ